MVTWRLFPKKRLTICVGGNTVMARKCFLFKFWNVKPGKAYSVWFLIQSLFTFFKLPFFLFLIKSFIEMSPKWFTQNGLYSLVCYVVLIVIVNINLCVVIPKHTIFLFWNMFINAKRVHTLNKLSTGN